MVKASEIIQDNKHIITKRCAISRNSNLDTWFEDKGQNFVSSVRKISNEISKILWTLALTFISESSYIELPNKIKQEHVCINIKNNSNTCFVWAVVSALYPVNWSSYPDWTTIITHSKRYSVPMTIPSFLVDLPICLKTRQKHIQVYYLIRTITEMRMNILLNTTMSG